MADTLARHVAQACAGADLEVEDLWDILDDPDQGVYRPRMPRHRIAAYAARAAVES